MNLLLLAAVCFCCCEDLLNFPALIKWYLKYPSSWPGRRIQCSFWSDAAVWTCFEKPWISTGEFSHWIDVFLFLVKANCVWDTYLLYEPQVPCRAQSLQFMDYSVYDRRASSFCACAELSVSELSVRHVTASSADVQHCHAPWEWHEVTQRAECYSLSLCEGLLVCSFCHTSIWETCSFTRLASHFLLHNWDTVCQTALAKWESNWSESYIFLGPMTAPAGWWLGQVQRWISYLSLCCFCSLNCFF